jgi:hypothetical protein
MHYIAYIKSQTNFHSDARRHPMMPSSGRCHNTVSSQNLRMLIRMFQTSGEFGRTLISLCTINNTTRWHSLKLKTIVCVIRLDKNKKKVQWHILNPSRQNDETLHILEINPVCFSPSTIINGTYILVHIQISGSCCGIYTSNYQIYFEI